MTDLSPAAAAVLEAFWRDLDFREDFTPANIGAALRAVADQVVPLCSAKSDLGIQRMMIRNDLLIIAAELEGAGA